MPDYWDICDCPRRMAEGEAEAIDEFTRVFRPRLYAFFIRHDLNPMDAEDLAADCATDIALRADRYVAGPHSGFSKWVFTLAQHKLADWQRWRRRTAPSAYLGDIGPIPDTRGLDSGGSALDPAVVRAVHEAFGTLPWLDQEVLSFREQQLSYREIGHLLGMRPSSARVRHSRALNRLRTLLEKDRRMEAILRHCDPIVVAHTGCSRSQTDRRTCVASAAPADY